MECVAEKTDFVPDHGRSSAKGEQAELRFHSAKDQETEPRFHNVPASTDSGMYYLCSLSSYLVKIRMLVRAELYFARISCK